MKKEWPIWLYRQYKNIISDYKFQIIKEDNNLIALKILKIIGIILLAIIGLVLALLLLVLFCPFFYQIKLVNKEQFQGTARVTWLFGLVRCTVSYKEKLNIILRIFGIPFYNYQKKKEKTETDSNKDDFINGNETKKEYTALNKNKNIAVMKDAADENNSTEEINSNECIKRECKADESTAIETNPKTEDGNLPINADALYDVSSKQSTQNNVFENEYQQSDTNISSANDKNINNKKHKKNKKNKGSKSNKKNRDGLINKIKTLFHRLIRYLSELPDEIIKLKDTIGEKCQKALDTIEYYQNLANKPGTKKVLQFLKKEIILILRHIKPYRGEVFVDYQSDDPEKAAKVMQLYALALPILPKKTSINSAFSEENKLDFQIVIKGRLFLFYLGYHALIIIFNKKLKRFISLIKREE